MVKIGVFVFTHMLKQRTAKKKDMFFDGQNYIGIRYLLSEIKKPHKVFYVSAKTINTVDFCLVSITSYYDILNIINSLYGIKITCKVIIGGAGLNNVKLLRDIADIAVIGRGEGMINQFLSNQKIEGVWYKEDNYDFDKKIKIQRLKRFIEIKDVQLGMYKERSVGCRKKCFFCQYSWKNKFVSEKKEYSSGLTDRETIFNEIDWGNYTRGDLISAIDGVDEKTREIINKELSKEEIYEKFIEIDRYEKDYYSLKLYCLVGYPFEKEIDFLELSKIVKKAAKKTKNRLNIILVCPHFAPMPFTPMELEPVNSINFRERIKTMNLRDAQIGNVKLYVPFRRVSSPLGAMEETILNRCEDARLIKKIICSSKYNSSDFFLKKKILYQFFGQHLGKVNSVCDYVERIYPLKTAQKKYGENVKKYAST